MQSIINFIKYHNLFTIILGLVLIATASVFASEDVRNAVIGEEIVTTSGTDNSQILLIDLDNFDFQMTITNVTEDSQNYYVNYQFRTLGVENGVWQWQIRKPQLTVAKADLGGQDLGLFAQEELAEIVDYELAYLREIQTTERERGQTQIVETTEYTGLIGLVLDIKNKILPGYEPVVQPESVTVEESSEGTGSEAISQPAEEAEVVISRPETIIDSHPAEVTASTEATFEFQANKEGCFFQCKINSLNWINCTSPKTYAGLVPGEYTFQVFATDAQGNYDTTPATFSWTVIEPEPEE